jgi:hypothetical protein
MQCRKAVVPPSSSSSSNLQCHAASSARSHNYNRTINSNIQPPPVSPPSHLTIAPANELFFIHNGSGIHTPHPSLNPSAATIAAYHLRCIIPHGAIIADSRNSNVDDDASTSSRPLIHALPDQKNTARTTSPTQGTAAQLAESPYFHDSTVKYQQATLRNISFPIPPPPLPHQHQQQGMFAPLGSYQEAVNELTNAEEPESAVNPMELAPSESSLKFLYPIECKVLDNTSIVIIGGCWFESALFFLKKKNTQPGIRVCVCGCREQGYFALPVHLA